MTDLEITIIEGMEEFTEALKRRDVVDAMIPRFSDRIFGLPEDRLRVLSEAHEANRLSQIFRVTQWRPPCPPPANSSEP